MTRVPVTFEPSGVVGWVDAGGSVLEAAREAGVALTAPCGGRGVCGACGIRVIEGALAAPDEIERQGLRRAPAGVRLACRARAVQPVTVRPVAAVSVAMSVSAAGDQDLVAAVDLGTTNVAVALVERGTGRDVARGNAPNRQSAWGADVLSRVAAATEGAAEGLSSAAAASILDALAATGVRPSEPRAWYVAGNTAMSALLARADVSPLAVAPFEAPRLPSAVSAREMLGDAVDERAQLTFVPPLESFVGGDVRAGLAATGLWTSSATGMLIDVGTNAEMALVHRGVVYVASAAAGPAFEGVGLSSGGPAIEGAVVDVEWDGDSLVPTVIGHVSPGWLGGSGIVSLLAWLRGQGHVDADGRLHAAGPLEQRFDLTEDRVTRVCPFGERVCLTQLDVRAMQLAKAAIRVGIDSVLRAAGLDAEHVDLVVIGGAFGGGLREADLIRIGMVPRGFTGKMSAGGNTSLTGAIRLALADGREVEPESLEVRHVQLASDPRFNEALVSALVLDPMD